MARTISTRRKSFNTALAWLIGLVVFFPILWIFTLSFKTEADAIKAPLELLASSWTFENYSIVQERSNYMRFLTNSIIIAGGSKTDILAFQNTLKNQIGKCFGAKGTTCGNKNFCKNRQKENGLDQNDNRYRARQVGYDNVPETLKCRCAIHFRGFQLFGIQGLNCGEQNKRGKRQPLPTYDHNKRRKAGLAQPFHGGRTEDPPDMSKKSIDGIHKQVFPNQCRDCRHDEKRCNNQNPDNALSPNWLIQEEGQKNTQKNRDNQNAAYDNDRCCDARPERAAAYETDVVIKSNPH